METWIEFGKGPMFRLSFVLMILGLLRIFGIAFILGMKRSIRLLSGSVANENPTEQFVKVDALPQLFWSKSIRALFETIFYLAVIIVPLFVAAHVIQWQKGVGFSWWELPQTIADRLTLIVIFLSPIMVAVRLWSHAKNGRGAAFARPMFVFIPFLTGYICVNGSVSPTAYYTSMLLHVWVGNLLMLAIGFSSLVDLIIIPISNYFSKMGLRFGRFADPIWRATIGGGEQS